MYISLVDDLNFGQQQCQGFVSSVGDLLVANLKVLHQKLRKAVVERRGFKPNSLINDVEMKQRQFRVYCFCQAYLLNLNIRIPVLVNQTIGGTDKFYG